MKTNMNLSPRPKEFYVNYPSRLLYSAIMQVISSLIPHRTQIIHQLSLTSTKHEKSEKVSKAPWQCDKDKMDRLHSTVSYRCYQDLKHLSRNALMLLKIRLQTFISLF